jgi:hypothetical protein
VQPRWLPTAFATAASVLALASAWHSGRHMWHRITGDYSTYSRLSPADQRHAPAAELGLDGNIFDWYAQHVFRGDRVYFQVLPSGLGSMDLPTAVGYAGSFYLLPAVQVTDPRKATVVVSYFADPSFLHLRFVTQLRAGEQPIFVSRIRGPAP